MELKLPYGAELIEKYIEPRGEPGGGLAYALGNAMDKASGLYYRVRLDAYIEHFSEVVEALCIKPAYTDIETDVYKLPSYTVNSGQSVQMMWVEIMWAAIDMTLRMQVRFDNLYDHYFFEHLKYKIYSHFYKEKEDTEFGVLWADLSANARNLFLYKCGFSQELVPQVFGKELALAGLIDKDDNLGHPTEEGRQLMKWLLRTGKVT